MSLIEICKKILETPEATKQLEYLHKGIGTATESRIWLDLEIAVKDAELMVGQPGGNNEYPG